jgi:hypothetical protein
MTQLTVRMKKVIFLRQKEHSGLSMIENYRTEWESIKNIGRVCKEVVILLMIILNYIQILSFLFMVEKQHTLDLSCRNITECQIKKGTDTNEKNLFTILRRLIYYNE